MTSIIGKYQHFKNENMDDYFAAVGVPYMARKMMSMSSPLMEISLEGDKMTIKNVSLLRTVESSFKLNEEYEEHMPNTKIKSKTVIVNDSEIVTESVIPETGAVCGRHYKFTDEGCVITLTHEKAEKACKRYYNRVK
ncbi:fatty acid-binding protein, adipocyte isoform 1-T2 [Aphomia sociella]